MVAGNTRHAWEIPAAFRQIARVVYGRPYRGARSVVLAMAYFNPLRIGPHRLLPNFFGGPWEAIGTGRVPTGLRSYAGNTPIPLAASYAIQNKVPLKGRFPVSSCFPALMVAYYALSATWFN